MASKSPTKTCPKCGHEDNTGLPVCPIDGTAMKSKKTPAKDKFIGTTIAEKYQILSLLGRGGMSVVYKARHLLMDRLVAVKMLRQDLVSVPQLLERFKQESKAVSALRHQNIITVYDFGLLTDGTPYLIMDYLEGKTLSQIMKEEKHLSPERAMPLFAQACDALAHSHSRGVVHRDIKPGNLLIQYEADGTESLTIFDFGIAKMLGQDGSTINKLTSSGEVFGSPLYMSPEQCSGEKMDGRTDIYSLACVFHELILGQPPFKGDSPMDTLMRHLNDPVRPFATVAPDVPLPPRLEHVIAKALSKDPMDRYQTMIEFRDEILDAAGLQLPSRLMQSSSGHQTVMTTSTEPTEFAKREPRTIIDTSTSRRESSPVSYDEQKKGGGSFFKTAGIIVGIVVLIGLATGGIVYAVNQFTSDKGFVIAKPALEEDPIEKSSFDELPEVEKEDEPKVEKEPEDPEGHKTFMITEKIAPSQLSMNKLGGNVSMKFSALPRRHGWHVDLTELITPTKPKALLPDQSKTNYGDNTRSCTIHIITLAPESTPLADVASALYRKVFPVDKTAEKQIELPENVGDQDFYLQEITFNGDENVTEFILYLRRGERLFACQFSPVKTTREHMLSLINDFIGVVSVAIEK